MSEHGKSLGRIEWEARMKFYKEGGWHPDFQSSWDDLNEDQRAAMEAGADAVAEECAKIADKLSDSVSDHEAGAALNIAEVIRSLKRHPAVSEGKQESDSP
jgi:hypothetical protein